MIKFKQNKNRIYAIWINHKKEMIYSEDYKELDDFFKSYFEKDCIFLHGLKSRNKNFYEGDIFKFVKKFGVMQGSHFKNWILLQDEYGAMIFYSIEEENISDEFDIESYKYFEKIGNFFENPELMVS